MYGRDGQRTGVGHTLNLRISRLSIVSESDLRIKTSSDEYTVWLLTQMRIKKWGQSPTDLNVYFTPVCDRNVTT